jgi:hypothetical protein
MDDAQMFSHENFLLPKYFYFEAQRTEKVTNSGEYGGCLTSGIVFSKNCYTTSTE